MDLGKTEHDIDEVNDRIRAEYRTHYSIQNADLLKGNLFSTGDTFVDVAAGNSINVLLENPADSGKYVFTNSQVITTGEFLYHKSLNPTISSVGTDIQIVQRRSDQPNNNIASAYKNATVTEDSTRRFNDKIVGAQDLGNRVTGSTQSSPDTIVAPGDAVYFEAENVSSSAQTVTLDTDFAEVKAELVESLPQQ